MKNSLSLARGIYYPLEGDLKIGNFSRKTGTLFPQISSKNSNISAAVTFFLKRKAKKNLISILNFGLRRHSQIM